MQCTISTHAPRTGSDRNFRVDAGRQGISTHAPRTGSDAEAVSGCCRTKRFQPTLPARGATAAASRTAPAATDFNPRSPHGERRAGVCRKRHGDGISTHAPRTGSDSARQTATLQVCISTHAPRTGSDADRILSNMRQIISTHAPRTGSDKQLLTLGQKALNFNPRSPHGERRSRSWFAIQVYPFQPTLPARGATSSNRFFVRR